MFPNFLWLSIQIPANLLFLLTFINKFLCVLALILFCFADFPEIGWFSRRYWEASASSWFVEKIHILHFSFWFSSWLGGPHATSRYCCCDVCICYPCLSEDFLSLFCPSDIINYKKLISFIELMHFFPDIENIVSPVSVAHFSQYKLIKLLLTKLKNLGFHVCTPDGFGGSSSRILQERRILMGLECNAVFPTPEGATVGVTFLKEGKIEQRNFHCSILVGSDGARSTVRKLVGIDMKGERDLQKLVSVHFLSRNLGQYLLHKRPGMLFFIFNPEAIGVLVAHDLNQGEFVLQVLLWLIINYKFSWFGTFMPGEMWQCNDAVWL